MCIFRWSVMMILIASSVASAQPAVPRIGGDPTRDLRLTMQARKLLYDDPDLAPHNLGVIVNDRIAVLWGPAPSAEAMIRAEVADGAIAELTVYCTGDWDQARQADHAAAVTLIRP